MGTKLLLKKEISYFELKDNCFIILFWFLPHINMNQPQVYTESRTMVLSYFLKQGSTHTHSVICGVRSPHGYA